MFLKQRFFQTYFFSVYRLYRHAQNSEAIIDCYNLLQEGLNKHTMKTYIFERIYGSRKVLLHIEANNFEAAYHVLIDTVKHPADFKCLNP